MDKDYFEGKQTKNHHNVEEKNQETAGKRGKDASKHFHSPMDKVDVCYWFFHIANSEITAIITRDIVSNRGKSEGKLLKVLTFDL